MEPKEAIPLVAGLLLFLVVLNGAGVQNVLKAVYLADAWKFAAFLTLLALAVAVKAFRASRLLGQISAARFAASSKAYFAGQFLNEILLTGSGEVARIAMLKRMKVPASRSLACMLAERASDLLVIFAIGIAGAAVFFSSQLTASLALALAASAIIATILSTLLIKGFAQKLAARFAPLLEKFSKNFPERLFKAAAGFEKSAAKIRGNKKLLAEVFLLTTFAWALEVLAQGILLEAFGIRVAYELLAAIVAFSWLVGTFSMLPGGLGSREMTYSTLLAAAGHPLATVVSALLAYRLSVYIEFGVGWCAVRVAK